MSEVYVKTEELLFHSHKAFVKALGWDVDLLTVEEVDVNWLDTELPDGKLARTWWLDEDDDPRISYEYGVLNEEGELIDVDWPAIDLREVDRKAYEAMGRELPSRD